MASLDWAAMLASDKPTDKAPDDACNHSESGYKVREVVTENASQDIDSKRNVEACNHVTTVTTVFERPKGSESKAREETPGGGGLTSHAPETKAACLRPVIDYGLTDQDSTGGRMVGAPGDVLADLVHDLRLRYGARLDWVAVREQFEERAAIMEFDGLRAREEAEAAAAEEVRNTVSKP